MNKRCDNLNYLVVLRARRQLLLERAVGEPGGVRLAGKMAGDKDNIFFFFFMLHSPTEAQLKRQIAGAISYGGGNLSAFKLVPLQRLDRGMKISGQQTKECNLISANRCACQWLGRLCLTRFGGSRRRLHTEQR